ncbi:sucrose-6-phosphate hydrolase [Bacillus sp. TS-2]|nr:sucrose-6-phosphate hydrolase [Bacillus sp. TS-2]
MQSEPLYREKLTKVLKEKREAVESDPYRLSFHLMPSTGLLNDPNGFIYWRGEYHLFYQWMPFKTDHGAKCWGHYVTKDFIKWRHEKVALTPTEWFDRNGCYSGSAIIHEEKMYLFYTGNVKDTQGNRQTYQCLAISEDGIHFDKKGPVISLPEGYTAHFRDPKVWKHRDIFYMVVGAQTLEEKGTIALFESKDLLDWKYKGNVIKNENDFLNDFGYMFECPDLFQLNGHDLLIFCPQGLDPKGDFYHNTYQSGYVVGVMDYDKGSLEHGEFYELDRGFDFYAPQTTTDEQGRRIMFAWMGVPEQNEQDHPTISHDWLHNMTLPRELMYENNKLYQRPLQELVELRHPNVFEKTIQLQPKMFWKLLNETTKGTELLLDFLTLPEDWFQIDIAEAVRLIYSKEKQLFIFERKSYVDEKFERRQCFLRDLTSLQIFIDTSAIEIFINEGEEVFSARFYSNMSAHHIHFSSSGSCSFSLQKWSLTSHRIVS